MALDLAAKEDKSLEENFNITTIFQTWSRQGGYPLLTVTRDYGTNITTMKQKKYVKFENPLINANDTSKWWIPYNYATTSNPNFDDTTPNGWLKSNETQKDLNDSINANDWVLFNKQQTSYYRILYDDTNYSLLAKQLNGANFSIIHVLNRAQLLNDLKNFVSSGRVKIETLLEFLPYLRQETEYAPWKVAHGILLKLDNFLRRFDEYHKFRAFAANLTEKFYNNNSIRDAENETAVRKFARRLALTIACDFDLQACLDATHDTLFHHIRNGLEILENRDIIYQNGAKVATSDEMELLWQQFTEMGVYVNPTLSELTVTSIATVHNQTILENYLLKTIGNDTKTDSVWRINFMLTTIGRGQQSALTALRFLRIHSTEVLMKHELDNLDEYVRHLAHNIVISEQSQKEVSIPF